MKNSYIMLSEENGFIYSTLYLEQLKKLLGDPDKFNKMDFEGRRKIVTEIKKLNVFEDFSKKFEQDRIRYSIEFINKFFSVEKKALTSSVDRVLDQNSTRINSANLSGKLRSLVAFMLTILEKNFSVCLQISKEDILIKIDTNRLIYIIMDSIINTVEKNKNVEYQEFVDNNIVEARVVSHVFKHNLKENLVQFLLYIIHELDPKSLSKVRMHEILNQSVYLYQKSPLSHIVSQLEDCCDGTVFKSKTVKYISEKKKMETHYRVPLSILNYVPRVAHIPEIIKPEKWNSDNCIKYVKIIHDGTSEVYCGPDTKKCIEENQKKKMRINPNAIKAFKKLIDMSLEEYNEPQTKIGINPVIPDRVIENERLLRDLYKDDIIPSKTYQGIVVLRNKMYDKEISYTYQDFTKDISEQFNISIERYNNNNLFFKHNETLKNMEMQRDIFKSILTMSEIFEGFPLYFLNTVDYRLRMYPWSYLFSRTTGIYKYFLCDFKKTELTFEGFKSMLKSYYNSDMKMRDNFNNTTFKNIRELSDYFKCNRINIKQSDNLMYYTLLDMEIEGCVNSSVMETGFMIEVDQRASSSVFLSLTLRNEKLAKYSNLLDTKEFDVPSYLKDKSLKYFKDLEDVLPELYHDLTNNRNLHKKMFMTFCYNQTSWGRFLDVKKYFKDMNDLSDNEYKKFIGFSSRYEVFLDEVFNKLVSQREHLNNLVKMVIKKFHKIEIITLDGSKISWKIFKTVSEVIKYKNKENKMVSTRYRYAKTDELNEKKMIKSFIPGLIHSIDAAVMRLIILRMLDLNYNINHVHDSIMVHPNYLNGLYKVIEDIYCDNELFDDIIKKRFLDVTIGPIKNDETIEIYNYYDKHIKNSFDDFKVTKKKFNVLNMYRFE